MHRYLRHRDPLQTYHIIPEPIVDPISCLCLRVFTFSLHTLRVLHLKAIYLVDWSAENLQMMFYVTWRLLGEILSDLRLMFNLWHNGTNGRLDTASRKHYASIQVLSTGS